MLREGDVAIHDGGTFLVDDHHLYIVQHQAKIYFRAILRGEDFLDLLHSFLELLGDALDIGDGHLEEGFMGGEFPEGFAQLVVEASGLQDSSKFVHL